MLRFIYTCILGIVGAGIVHMAILLMLPDHSVHDAWSRLSAATNYYESVALRDGGPEETLPTLDNPFVEAAACRYNLEDGMLHIGGDGNVPFWTLAIFDQQGLNTFSVSDRVSTDLLLDVVILTPLQMQRLEGEIPAELSQSLFLETSVVEGFVLVRTFIPDETWQAKVRSFLNGIICQPLEQL